MTTQTYEQLIMEGIKGLSPKVLAEIADFVYFLRRRALEPKAFQEELKNALLRLELKRLSRREEAHLDEEFKGHAQRHPRK